MKRLIDRRDLPFPNAFMAITRRGGISQGVEFNLPVLTAGSAQWKSAFLRPGGRIPDSEGVLAFTNDEAIF